MSRNQNGIYTVPNSFTVNTTINPDRVNENFTDLGNEMTNSLPRDGRAPMTGQFVSVAGTLAQPGISFTGDPNSGFMWKSDGVVAYVVNGVEAFTMTSTGIVLTNKPAFAVYDLGTQSSGTVTVDYDNGEVQKVTMAGDITLLPADIPEGKDLQLNLTYSSGKLSFSGVARWVLGTSPPSASFADTGLDPNALPAAALITMVFSRVGNEVVGYVVRVR